jgi:ATP-dependent DNA helicase RecG
MPRKKFRHSPRLDAQGERPFHEYLQNQPAQLTTRSELLRLIRGGEDTYLELKVKLSNPERIAQGIVAIANTDGGTIIFGVNDHLRIEGVPNPEWVQAEITRICREEIIPSIVPMIDSIAFDSGKRVVAIEILGKKKPYRTRDGRFYMRFGAEKREVTRSELSMWLDEIRPLGFENIPLTGVATEDFDDGLLWSFAGAFDESVAPSTQYNTNDFLKKDLLLAAGTGEDFFPTVAALVLFGRNERVAELLPRSAITVARFSGTNGNAQLIEKTEITGNLHTQFEAALRFIRRYVDLAIERPSKSSVASDPAAKPRANYHLNAVIEAVANAIVHRDLAIRDILTRVVIYDDSIEFINARRTNGFAPPAYKAIRYGITQRLNPQIAAIFSRPEYGTHLPEGGLPMVLREAHVFSGRRAEVYTSNDEFKLKLYGT